MKISLSEELVDILKKIKAENKTLEEWSEIESSDMYQTRRFNGGFDADEEEFTFSYYDDDGKEYWIPSNYVQNPHRNGSFGEIVNGKFKERLRIDPATPPGQKGPNYSHYHKNGKGKHYSPREGDPDPGF